VADWRVLETNGEKELTSLEGGLSPSGRASRHSCGEKDQVIGRPRVEMGTKRLHKRKHPPRLSYSTKTILRKKEGELSARQIGKMESA